MPQLEPPEQEILISIRQTYGQFIQESASRHAHRQEVIAGIIMRESAGGRMLTPPGPTGTGDGGHGHGLMQIDDRSFAVFCNCSAWKDPAQNIEYGSVILQRKRIYLQTATLKKAIELTVDELERWSIAAYNCGEGRAFQAIKEHRDFDFYTTHRDYSEGVLRYADYYKLLIA
jgi:hypothetical protein